MKLIGYIYAIAAAVTWGLVYTIDQKILLKVSPLSYFFIGSVICVIMTLPVLFFDPQSIKVLFNSGKTNLLLIILSTFLSTLAAIFIYYGIKILGAPTASIFEIAYPFFVISFSYLFYKSGFNVYFLLGALMIFLGSIVIIKFG